MITAPVGYPSNSWGANGYGLAVAASDRVDGALVSAGL